MAIKMVGHKVIITGKEQTALLKAAKLAKTTPRKLFISCLEEYIKKCNDVALPD